MKTFVITYARENGTEDKETVSCKSKKLTKEIRNYFNNVNAEIISIDEL